ncbi:transposase [Acetobacter tropicalis]|nr:transposase [Acetobacter tropicalis]KAA8387504.1 transposase [Acetobacter tropicalis]
MVTTILDPAHALACDLAAFYHERWEIETAFDELKTHLRGARLCLRSKTPELVRQEFHGLMLAHFTIRSLMHEAALKVREDPDRLSFTHSLQVIRRKIGHMVLLSPSAEK